MTPPPNGTQIQAHRNPIEAIYPLSPTQQGILFHSLLTPGAGLYVIQLQITLEGDLVPADLRRACEYVIARHPVLRTVFVWKGRDKPLQVVSAQGKCEWEELDWHSLAPDAQSVRLCSFLMADRGRGFELDRAPLVRWTLARTSAQTYQLVWTYHHLLLDGWSTFRVLRQWLEAYSDIRNGRTPSLAPSRPYRDYVAWLDKQDLSQAEAFWRQTLQGLAPAAPLGQAPTVQDDSAGEVVSGRRERTLELSKETTAALQALARRYHLTLNTILQGAWALLLSHHTAESDIVFGATTSGRAIDLPGIENMVGLFINTLPARVRIQPHVAVARSLAELQMQQVQARQFEYTPLAEISKWSHVPAGKSLFESILVFENYPSSMPVGETRGDLSVTGIRSFEKTNYPLTLSVQPGTRLALTLSYDDQRFDEGAISQMIDHLRILLQGMLADPEQPLSTLPLLTASERQRWLVEWNATDAEYDRNHCIHEQFEAQVARKPHAVAVEYQGESLTFCELNRRANQLAFHLRRLGVRPETLVGLCVDRSPEMVVGLFGILKAGGAFLPLDPTYPPPRLAFMLGDARAPVVVTQERWVRRLPFAGAVVCLDADWSTVSHESEQNPVGGAVPENAAYVIYTSGSTGSPKGVVIQHRSVSNLLMALDRSVYTAQPEPRRVSLNGSLSFDTSVKQWIQLLRGRTLVIVPATVRLDGAALLTYADEHRLDVLDCTPTQLGLLLKAGWLHHPGHLPGHVLVAGEPIDATTWRALSESTRTIFYNLYGPTECTVDAAIARIDRREPRPNIGRPIANVRLYVLTPAMQPTPVGTPGELWIGGEGLARGYLDHPDLTADKFVPNPFTTHAGERLYRTGDLVRMLPAGDLEFLGRTDLQVKVRGFRIELEEIEAVLKRHPQVQAAVARVWENGDDRHLAAYYCAAGADIPTSELRQMLHRHLPEHMVPSVFVRLERLPLLPNGKVDRGALPMPDGAERAPVGEYVPPRDLIELQLAQVWETALGMRPVGIKDNFFDLGGHSLLALRVMALIQQAFEQDLPLSELLQGGTVEHLARLLRCDRLASTPRSLLVRLRSGKQDPPLFFVHPIGGNVLCYAELVRHLKPHRTIYALRALGLEEESEPLRCVQDMAARYIEEMRAVQPRDPYLLCGWSMGGLIAFEMASQLSLQGCAVRMLALLDSLVPRRHARKTDGDWVTNPPKEWESITYRATGFLAELGAPKGTRLQADPGDSVSTADELLHCLLEQSIALGLVPPDTGITQIRRLWRVYEANSEAMYHYIPDGFPGRITLLHARDNGLAVRDYGWEGVAQQPLDVHTVPGDHHTMLSPSHAPTLAETLQACIVKATQ